MPTTPSSLTVTLEICPALGTIPAQVYLQSWPQDFPGEINISAYRFGAKSSARHLKWVRAAHERLGVETGSTLTISAKREGNQKYSGSWTYDGQSLVLEASSQLELVITPERPPHRAVRLELERRLEEAGSQLHAYAHPLDSLYRAFGSRGEEPLTFGWLFGGSVCAYVFTCDRNERAMIERHVAQSRANSSPLLAYWYTPNAGLREVTLEQFSSLAADLDETVNRARREATQGWIARREQETLSEGLQWIQVSLGWRTWQSFGPNGVDAEALAGHLAGQYGVPFYTDTHSDGTWFIWTRYDLPPQVHHRPCRCESHSAGGSPPAENGEG